MPEVHLSQHATKTLQKLDKPLRERIKNKLRVLAERPVPSNAKYIGRNDDNKTFRLRIGDYRALYTLQEDIVLIAKIDKRPRVYDR